MPAEPPAASYLGRQLGSYELLSWLGAGGMGEVYRARDRKLGREVAVKVLPRSLSEDPARRARFEREARVLAALNHPHIATIYGFENADGLHAIVLELVEGPTLADRLAGGALPLGEAISLARQIADALDAAHEKGIVHRDLKPANVKLTPAGAAKVLDFGLAKTLDAAPGGELSKVPTLPGEATSAGVVLGTAPYMSPEQARGQPVDGRTDVWAFGCVLYEMLTGQQPFARATLSDTLAAILQLEPDWTRLPAGTPTALRRLLRRCLTKDVKERFRDIGDVRIQLDEALAAAGEETLAGAGGAAGRRGPSWWTLAVVASIALASSGALAWLLQARGSAAPQAVTRATLTLPARLELDTAERAAPLALSQDGRRLAYVARGTEGAQLYLRKLDAFDAVVMPGTDGARYPFFSPDGRWVAFFADGKLKRVSTDGGSPQTVCDAPVVGRGGTWGPDGTIVFDPGESGLVRVAAEGGRPELVTSRDAEMDARNLSWPQFLPGGRALLATEGVVADAALVVLSLDDGGWRRLGAGSQAQYAASGHLVFHAPAVREGELQAVAFDAERLAIQGTPVSVLAGVFRAQSAGGAYFALAPSGALAFARGSYARTLVRVDRDGRRTPLVEERRGFRHPRVSPDGRRLAVTIDPRPSQIWIYDLARGSGFPLAREGHSLSPIWTSDGRRVAYSSRGEIDWRAADASSAPERLLARDRPQYPGAWSRDGRQLVFIDDHPTNSGDLWLMTRGGGERPLVATPAQEIAPALSPDGRWLAYTSDESGRPEVYVRPFPNVDDGKWIVSTQGGGQPVWSPAGGELYYMNGTAILAVAVEARGASFHAASPVLLFTGPFETGSPVFDVSPDGTHFVMVEADPDAKPTQLQLVLNWTEELKRLVPAQSP